VALRPKWEEVKQDALATISAMEADKAMKEWDSAARGQRENI